MAPLTVMTRNLYVGSEFAPIMQATSLQEALVAVPMVLREILASDHPSRAARIAGEIGEAEPAIVGVQEAALLREGPPDANEPSDVVLDYLALLADALGGRYEVAAEVANIDATMPNGFPPTRMLRLTDRGALLVAAGMSRRDVYVGSFDAKAVVEIGRDGIPFTRGWISAEIELDETPVRVVTTHLETSQFPDAQLAQAEELVDGPLHTDGPLILMGDLNAQATFAPAYRMLLDHGFIDAWSARHPNAPGLTCCQAPDLRNDESLLYERIDFVMVRGPFEILDARLTGNALEAKTDGGLWPSDHAGLVVTLEI